MIAKPIQLAEVKRARGATAGDHWPTARKLAWIEQLARDTGLSALALRLGLILATRFVNHETGDAWPSQDTLGAQIGGTPDGIRRAINSLEGRGHLAVVRAPSRGKSNRYRPLVRLADVGEKARRTDGVSEPEGQTPGRGFDPMKGQTPVCERPDNRAGKAQTPVGPIPLEYPLEEPCESGRSKRRKPQTAIPEGFPDREAIARAADFLASKGRPNIDVELEAVTFREHALANDRRCRDWHAAFRMWVVKARPTRPAAGARGQWSGIDVALDGLNEDWGAQ